MIFLIDTIIAFYKVTWQIRGNAADSEIIEGVALVDESAITGEYVPVIREASGERAAVTGGTRVLSDRIK